MLQHWLCGKITNRGTISPEWVLQPCQYFEIYLTSKYIWRTSKFLLFAPQSPILMLGCRIRRDLLLLAFLSAFLLGRAVAQDSPVTVDPGAAQTPSLDYKNQGAQEITKLIFGGFDRWNARDLDAYMEMFWKSPDFMYSVDNEIVWGWADLKAELMRGYPDRSTMGTVNSERLEIRVLTSDLATIANSWSMQFPKAKIVGITTGTLRKFGEGWRVISAHTSTCEFPLN
jgi:hypothetical protein